MRNMQFEVSGASLDALVQGLRETVQQEGPTLAAGLSGAVRNSVSLIQTHPLTAAILAGALFGAGLIEKNFGPIVRDNEAAAYRTRFTERLVVLYGKSYGAHRRIYLREEKNLAPGLLDAGAKNMKFSPQRLTNDRGRFHLGNFEFTVTEEPVQTADGAIVNASASVTFRLDPQHVREFINFVLGSFDHAFVERLKSAINSEIGAHERDRIIGHQVDACQSLQAKFKQLVEGAPGHSKRSGLGIIVERLNLSVKPASRSGVKAYRQERMNTDDLVSLDTVRWLNDLIRREENPENRVFLREAYVKLIDAAQMIQVAKELGASGNFVVVTPDEAGLTKSAAASEHLLRQRKTQPPSRTAKDNGGSAPFPPSPPSAGNGKRPPEGLH